MIIPLVDLSKTPQNLKKKITKKISIVIQNGHFISGVEGKKFEEQFAKYLGISYCIGVGSGTDALLLSYKALGLKQDDEAIVPAMSFIATVSPLIQLGIKPVLVDVDPHTGVIDSKDIEKAITKKTKAIVVVHLHGYPCSMDDICAIAKKHSLFVIEDAAQAHGSMYHGQKLGTFGHIATFSFYPGKNLGAYGDAGAVVTKNASLAQKIHILRNHGEKEKYNHSQLGYNSRLDEIQAVVLSEKLVFLEVWNKKRRFLAKMYSMLLQNLPLTFLKEEQGKRSNYHIYNIQLRDRNALYTFLQKHNIFAGIHYPLPLHMQPALHILGYKKGDFPNAEGFAKTSLSLPLYPQMTQKELKIIVSYIQEFFDKKT